MKKIWLAVAYCLAVTCGLVIASRFVHVAVNTSSSMPLGFYRTWSVDRPPRRGDIVTACAPIGAALIGETRGYLPPGPCDGGTAPLIKYVAGTGGDVVAVTRCGIAIDGNLLPESRSLERDGEGRPMRAYERARTRLPSDAVWLFAPNGRSFDSRYFGPVSVTRIRAFAAPFLWPPHAEEAKFAIASPPDKRCTQPPDSKKCGARSPTDFCKVFRYNKSEPPSGSS